MTHDTEPDTVETAKQSLEETSDSMIPILLMEWYSISSQPAISLWMCVLSILAPPLQPMLHETWMSMEDRLEESNRAVSSGFRTTEGKSTHVGGSTKHVAVLCGAGLPCPGSVIEIFHWREPVFKIKTNQEKQSQKSKLKNTSEIRKFQTVNKKVNLPRSDVFFTCVFSNFNSFLLLFFFDIFPTSFFDLF